MALQITAGKLFSRGTDGMSPAQLQQILDNPQQVEKIYEEMDNRIAIFRKVRGEVLAAQTKLEASESALAEHDAKLAEEREALVADSKNWTAKHEADMGALSRRTREVREREEAAIERDTGLDAKEKDIEAVGRTRETELAERERVIETQESAAEERDAEVVEKTKLYEDKVSRFDVAVRIMNQAFDRVKNG